MGLLDRTKSPPPPPPPQASLLSTKTTACKNTNLKTSGNKKATYSFSSNLENVEPTNTAKQQDINKFCHDNPVFESENSKNLNEDLKQQIKRNLLQDKNNIELVVSNCNNNNNSKENSIESNGAGLASYAITSSTTLLYITSPPGSTPSGNNQIKTDSTLNKDLSSITSTTSSPHSSSSYCNTAEKLAAAAAAAVTCTAESMVDIPNFGEGLSSMMDHNRMDDIDLNSNKKFESKINQSHGFTFGEGNNANKNNYTTKSAAGVIGAGCNNSSSGVSTALSDDDGNLKLTSSSSSYDIKIRRRRACQMKACIILIGMLLAGFIGSIFAYFFLKYDYEHELHMNLTRNMVADRESKFGSNRLEIVVPFEALNSNLNPDDTHVLVNKIQEIISRSFSKMNKSVEVNKLYALNQTSENKTLKSGSYKAIIDVEINNAAEFAHVPLLLNEGRISVAESSRVLQLFRDTFKNTTIGSNLNRQLMKINYSDIDILFDQKPVEFIENKLTVTPPVDLEVSRLFVSNSTSDHTTLTTKIATITIKSNSDILITDSNSEISEFSTTSSSSSSSSPSSTDSTTLSTSSTTIATSTLPSTSTTVQDTPESSSTTTLTTTISSSTQSIPITSTPVPSSISSTLSSLFTTKIDTTTLSTQDDMNKRIEVKDPDEFVSSDVDDSNLNSETQLNKNDLNLNRLLSNKKTKIQLPVGGLPSLPRPRTNFNKNLKIPLLPSNSPTQSSTTSKISVTSTVEPIATTTTTISSIVPSSTTDQNELDILLQINSQDDGILSRLIKENPTQN